MLKKPTCWAVLIYGAMIAILGYIGYRDQKSLVSALMGCGTGGLLVLSSFLMFAQKKAGAYSALFLTLLLTAIFSYRYSTTARTIPAMLAVFSGGMLLFLLAQSSKWRNE